jgi:hypothetical protein
MMQHFLLSAAILCQAAADPAADEAIKRYVQHCEEARSAAIVLKEKEIKALAGSDSATAARFRTIQVELQQLKEQPAPLLRMSMPPTRDGVGLLVEDVAGHPNARQTVDVLEVVDDDEAIVRAWYAPSLSSVNAPFASDDPTFVDLWLEGIATSDLAAGMAAKLPQVFQVTGNKLFDTTCGKRSLPLLRPIDISRYRSGNQR